MLREPDAVSADKESQSVAMHLPGPNRQQHGFPSTLADRFSSLSIDAQVHMMPLTFVDPFFPDRAQKVIHCSVV